MTDLETIEKAITDGYYVAGRIFSVAGIQQGNKEFLRTGYAAQSADAFIKFFDLQTGKDVLFDSDNEDKFIIVLKKGSSEQIEIVTSDSQCIKRAKQQLAFQNETVGISIIVYCAASGGSSEPDQIPHVDRIIPQLNQLLGWNFKQIEASKFKVSKKLDSTNDEDAKKELKGLRLLLNHIAITRKAGIRIERYAISKIPRFGPYISAGGPIEFNMPPLTLEEIERFEKFISAPLEIRKIVDGLNQTYLLTSLDSRLALLWAITESVFTDKPEPLLSSNEIKSILESAKEIQTLKGQARLIELENALRDPNRLPSKSRNKRISENIAKALGLNADDVYREVKNASEVRGKYLHELKSDSGKLHSAEKYLRTTIETYLEKQLR